MSHIDSCAVYILKACWHILLLICYATLNNEKNAERCIKRRADLGDKKQNDEYFVPCSWFICGLQVINNIRIGVKSKTCNFFFLVSIVDTPTLSCKVYHVKLETLRHNTDVRPLSCFLRLKESNEQESSSHFHYIHSKH